MAKEARKNLQAQGAAASCAILASGKNPDNTDFTQAVTGTVTTAQPAVTATEVASSAADEQGIAATANLRLLGFTIQNDHASDIAKVTLRHGAADSDPAVARGSADVDRAEPYEIPGGGVSCANGVFIDRNGVDSTIILYTVISS